MQQAWVELQRQPTVVLVTPAHNDVISMYRVNSACCAMLHTATHWQLDYIGKYQRFDLAGWATEQHHHHQNKILLVNKNKHGEYSLLLQSMFLTSFLCVSILLCPQLPVSVQRSHHHLPNRVEFEFFKWKSRKSICAVKNRAAAFLNVSLRSLGI